MNIEAVIVCNNYSDFLEHTLPENLQHLDGVVVVTTPEDKATRALCEKYSVDVLDTNVFFEKGDAFNKGRAINLGLSHLRHDDWLLHLDADTMLPHRFRTMLEHARLDKRNLYGADRLNVHGHDHWMKHKPKTVPQFAYRYLVTAPDPFKVGARLIHMEYGYCPIGYFQLWHASEHRKYPINQGSAEHTDVLFSVQWPRERRILLPELFVFHLESERANMGANWKGRTTKPFKPSSGEVSSSDDLP
jgi:hypothetical protein